MECKSYYFEAGTFISQEENAVDEPSTDENDNFVMRTTDMRPARAGIQHMIETALPVFQEFTSDRRIESCGRNQSCKVT